MLRSFDSSCDDRVKDSDLRPTEGRVQDNGVEYRPSRVSAIGGVIRALGVWKRGSSMIGSSPNTAESSILMFSIPVLCSSRPDIDGETGSTLNSGKKSVAGGDRAASEGSSQRIQSS